MCEHYPISHFYLANIFFSPSFNTNILKSSTTRNSRKSDNGQPCQIPLDDLKKDIGLPLIKTIELGEFTQPMIQFVISTLRPI